MTKKEAIDRAVHKFISLETAESIRDVMLGVRVGDSALEIGCDEHGNLEWDRPTITFLDEANEGFDSFIDYSVSDEVQDYEGLADHIHDFLVDFETELRSDLAHVWGYYEGISDEDEEIDEEDEGD